MDQLTSEENLNLQILCRYRGGQSLFRILLFPRQWWSKDFDCRQHLRGYAHFLGSILLLKSILYFINILQDLDYRFDALGFVNF